MHKRVFAISAVIVSLVVGAWAYAAGVDGSQFAGKWEGKWASADGGGKFNLTITAADGKLGGSVNASSDTGEYTATFSAIKFDGNNMTAKYNYPPDNPPDQQGEITLTATFEPSTAKGTWSLGPKGQEGQAMATGTWTVTKK